MSTRAFWDRGVEAHGVDISVISKVRPDMANYCSVGSITEPLKGHYDLVVCIEVLEHIPPEEVALAIQNLTSSTDTLLFSSTPDDFN